MESSSKARWGSAGTVECANAQAKRKRASSTAAASDWGAEASCVAHASNSARSVTGSTSSCQLSAMLVDKASAFRSKDQHESVVFVGRATVAASLVTGAD